MRVEQQKCMVCEAGPGTLTIDVELVARPLGTFSISGSTMKVTAAQLPVLKCSGCGLHVVGRFSRDGRQYEFPNPVADQNAR